MVKIAAFTGGKTYPSARFRIRQHIEELGLNDTYIKEFYTSVGRNPAYIYKKRERVIWGIRNISQLIPNVLQSRSYDKVFLQRELISTLFTLEPLLKKPIIFDIDDAVFLRKGGKHIQKILRISDSVICGNSYLADWASNYHKKIHIVPTAVDSNYFVPSKNKNHNIIVWSGTSGGFKYLYEIEDAFVNVCKELPNTILRIVSDKKPEFSKLLTNNFEFIRWSPETEVSAINDATVGIMPLEDTPWERGKCSYKMLTYMSCGLPVVVSNVGMNNEVLAKGNCGFGTQSIKDWTDSLLYLLNNPSESVLLGNNGRQIIENNYSKKIISKQLLRIFND